MSVAAAPSATRPRWALAMGLYLLGIFMGAIDTGIVTPARTVIQSELGVDDRLGVWMITMYTLAYAAAIPIMGKLADRIGRKKIYLVSIALFGVGSLLCGLSSDVGSFGMLIGARALQALGGGGILPIATAEIGTEVPEERRGLALGLVGAVYGVANIFGASAGSFILDIAGTANWQWIFYVNVPIAALIVLAGIVFMPDHRAQSVAKIDVLGALLLVAMILSLLYGLRNIDFFAFVASVQTTSVWPFLVAFAVLVPVFVLAERRASDPILNLRYFTSRALGSILLLSLLSGFVLMAVIFVPQFAENSLRIKTGAGGYAVIAIGLASGIGAPLSGTLTDRFGPRPVLGFGALASLSAALVTWFWTIPQPSLASVLTSLGLFGLGLGFVIGTPLNYMMLERTPKKEASSGLATLSLVRSIGTTLAPAIMVGFLAQAGTLLQDRLTDQLPTSVPAPVLPYASELQAKFAEMKADENLADQLAGVDLPDLGGQATIQIDPASGGTLPADLVELLKSADVTNIANRTKTVATRMFSVETPARIADIQAGVEKGIAGLDTAKAKLESTQSDMSNSLIEMATSLDTMSTSQGKIAKQISTMDGQVAEMTKGIKGMDSALAGMAAGVPGIQSGIAGMDEGLAQQRAALKAIEDQLALLAAIPAAPPTASGGPVTPPASPTPTAPPTPVSPVEALQGQAAGLKAAIATLESERGALVKQLTTLKAQQADVTKQRAGLSAARAGIETGRTKLKEALAKLTEGHTKLAEGRAELTTAHDKIVAAQSDLAETRREMVVLDDAVPGAFDAALATYLGEVEAKAPAIEETFQSTLNDGFRGVFAIYGAAAVLMLLVLPLIPATKRPDEPLADADADGPR